MTPGSLESASLTTWTTALSTLEARAAEHDRFSQDLLSQVAKALEVYRARYEDLRRSHADYQTRLLKERDSSYSDLKKTKTKYDSICQEVENRRKKTENSFDFGKQKAQNAYQQQVVEMHNQKNTYLISINVTNKLKERYYHEYVPELLDSLQDLSETRVAKMNSVWALASHLESAVMERSKEQLDRLSAEITRNDPSLDSMMFAQHNTTQWAEPPDMTFDPSPVWLDNDMMAVDEASKTYLRNMLGKSKPLAREMKAEADKKHKELENMKRIRRSIREGKDKRDEAELVKALFWLSEEMHAIERKRLTAEIEMSTITAVVGDLSLGAKNHPFKAETFKIPTNCDLCGDRIWGLSAKGQNCKDCGFTCHSKCEMKVPADCPGEQSKEEKKKLKAERQEAAHAAMAVEVSNSATNSQATSPGLARQDTMNSLSSGYATSAQRSVSGLPPRSSALGTEEPVTQPRSLGDPAPTSKPAPTKRNRVVAPPPAAYVSAPPTESTTNGASRLHGKMIYSYEARDEGEISVKEGREITILEGDGKKRLFGMSDRADNALDGGWTKIKAGLGQEGVVPTTYIEELSPEAAAPKPAERPVSVYSDSSATSTNATKKKGPAVAPRRGARKVKYCEALYAYTAQGDGEFDMQEGERFELISMGSGDGWADVAKGGETRSVPANYIQEL
jgi:formin-binding protein 1